MAAEWHCTLAKTQTVTPPQQYPTMHDFNVLAMMRMNTYINRFLSKALLQYYALVINFLQQNSPT